MNGSQAAVDAFLTGVRSGVWQDMGAHYHADAVFSGTVPRWHFVVRGSEAIVRQMEEWLPLEAKVTDVHVQTGADGASVEFERRWSRPPTESAGPEEIGVRQAHIFRFDSDGRIVEQHGHCAGIWDAATFAEVEQALSAS